MATPLNFAKLCYARFCKIGKASTGEIIAHSICWLVRFGVVLARGFLLRQAVDLSRPCLPLGPIDTLNQLTLFLFFLFCLPRTKT